VSSSLIVAIHALEGKRAVSSAPGVNLVQNNGIVLSLTLLSHLQPDGVPQVCPGWVRRGRRRGDLPHHGSLCPSLALLLHLHIAPSRDDFHPTTNPGLPDATLPPRTVKGVLHASLEPPPPGDRPPSCANVLPPFQAFAPVSGPALGLKTRAALPSTSSRTANSPAGPQMMGFSTRNPLPFCWACRMLCL